MNPNEKAPPNPGFPLHRLNTAQTKAWLRFPNSRRMLADVLAKKYPGTGVGLLAATLRLFVLIDPTGKYRELAPPFTKFQMWQVANAPHIENGALECACRNYYDPEVEGSWEERIKAGENVGHHPFCQFRDTAAIAYDTLSESAVRRVEEDKCPQARPDEWIKSIELVKGS